MLTEWKKADIRKFPAQTIICPVNCVGTMGNGLAYAIKDKYPMSYVAYREALRRRTLGIGKCSIFKLDPDGSRQILFFATKAHWKDDSELMYITSGLEYIVANYKTMGITSLAIPPIGSGKGNLPFDLVNHCIESTLEDIPIPVMRVLRHY